MQAGNSEGVATARKWKLSLLVTCDNHVLPWSRWSLSKVVSKIAADGAYHQSVADLILPTSTLGGVKGTLCVAVIVSES